MLDREAGDKADQDHAGSALKAAADGRGAHEPGEGTDQ